MAVLSPEVPAVLCTHKGGTQLVLNYACSTGTTTGVYIEVQYAQDGLWTRITNEAGDFYNLPKPLLSVTKAGVVDPFNCAGGAGFAAFIDAVGVYAVRVLATGADANSAASCSIRAAYVPVGIGSTAGATRIWSGAGQSITAGNTTVCQHPARRKTFSGYKLVIGNWGAAFTVTKLTAGSPPTSLSTGSDFTLTDVTAKIPASGVIPAAISGTGNDIVPSLTLTDLIINPSATRTDDATKTALVQTRMYCAATYSGIQVGASDFANFNAADFADGRQYAGRLPAGDQTVVVGAGNAPSYAGSFLQPATVIFYYDVPTVVWAVCGDSNYKGHLTTTGNGNFAERASILMSTDTQEVSVANFAWTGQTSTASRAYARYVIDTIKPERISFPAWSVNDASGGNHTQTLFDSDLADWLYTMDYALSRGVKPIPSTHAPASLTAPEDARRLVLNAKIVEVCQSLGLPYVPIAETLEDPANRRLLLTSLANVDGIHWNDAGHILVAKAAVNMIGNLR